MSGRITSIEQLREEKNHLLDEARNITERMQKRTYAKFAPASDSYFNSGQKFIRFIGYGITAYKTAMMIKKFVSTISSFRRK